MLKPLEEAALEFVVFDDVPSEVFGALADAIGALHPRFTYNHGQLEMRRLLVGVTPEQYARFVEAIGNYRLRHTYDGWCLEMMSPLKDHDWVSRLINRLIEAIAFEYGIIIQTIGSTTIREKSGEPGIQPDESYYIASEPLVRSKTTYDPGVDPPPDLIVEIDVTSASLDRMEAMARIGVPEVWRFVKGELYMYLLQEGQYVNVQNSLSFPVLDCGTLNRFIQRREVTNESQVKIEFLEWLRAQPHSESGES